jgi:RND family efflux transporter MFP subunit
VNVLRRPVFIRLGLFAPLVAAAACSSAPPAHEADGGSTPVPVVVQAVEPLDWPATFEAGGTLTPRNTAMISSRILAPITAVHVRAGDRVRRGQPLVDLDAAELTAHAAQAAAGLAAATQASNAADADLRSARAALTLARVAHDRVKTLHDQRSATTQELDQAVADFAMAQARLDAAEARLKAAAAALEAADAASRAADIARSYGVLSAPFDGIIADRAADPGTTATPGALLLVVEDPATLQLEVRLDATRVTDVHAGDAVDVCIDGEGESDGPWVAGRVTEIARIDPSAHSFAVKIALPSAGSWRSGLFGRARFRGAARRTLAVPATAVVRRGQLAFVYVADAAGVARLRAVSTGATDERRVELLDGVAPGERIVVSPPPGLEDGARITATPSAPAEAGR